MSTRQINDVMNVIKENVIFGHVDQLDEGFDGNMEGKPGVSELVQTAIEKGVSAQSILTALSSGMTIVGEKYESEEYLMPDMLASAECVSVAMDILTPCLLKENIERKGTFVIATMEGDLHDIGKNIVAIMLKGDGYDVKDLGSSVTAEKIVEAVKANNARFVGLSALLTTTMIHMQSVIDLLKSKGLRDSVKVLIGGAPTTPDFAQQIGADAYCKDAFAALDVMRQKTEGA